MQNIYNSAHSIVRTNNNWYKNFVSKTKLAKIEAGLGPIHTQYF